MWVAAMLVVLYAACCAYLYAAQRSFIYFPVPAARNVAAEDLRFDLAGASVQVWRLHATADEAILYFGGNAENVAHNVPQFAQWFPDKAVYLVNYRGYGASTGAPTEAALFADAEFLFDHISKAHARITVIGRSLGSGVALRLAATRRPERLVLVTPFHSIAAIAQSALPMFPVRALLKDRFDSLAYAGNLEVPVLVLIAAQDEVIPRASSDTLAAAIESSLLTVSIIDQASHNTIHLVDAYAAELRRYLQ